MSRTNSDNEANKTVKETPAPPPVEPIRLPTIDEVRGQDIWNNCGVRSVVSGVMGLFLFEIFTRLLFDLFYLFEFCLPFNSRAD